MMSVQGFSVDAVPGPKVVPATNGTQTTSSHSASPSDANQVQHNGASSQQTEKVAQSKPVNKIEYDVDNVSKRIWLNVVNPSSGKVIQELPPEAVRKILDALSAKPGSLFDQKF